MYCGYQFICVCPCYVTLRSRYIDNLYFVEPSVLKVNLLMCSTNKNVLINLAKYFRFSLDTRTSIQI